MALPQQVRLVEVGPRDGLQNEKTPLSADDKIQLVDLLSQTGLKAIEAASFVSPKWVPQMASSDEVMRKIQRVPGISYSALTPNMKGLEAALAVGTEEVAIFAAASESFSQKNINCTIAESLKRFEPVMDAAKDAGVRVRGYVSCVLDCPYEGAIDAASVANISAELMDMGCYEVSLGDTIGTGTAVRVQTLIEQVSQQVAIEKLAGHFHDTYGQALANIYAAMQMGVSTFDSSIAGLGGCPYAQGASGNVSTEDVLYMLDGLGVETGVDMQKLLDCSAFISDKLARPPVSKAANALLSKRNK